MKWALDTEFHDRGNRKTELLSVGICGENGKKFYAVVKDADWKAVHEDKWLRDNVVPVLAYPGTTTIPYATRAQIATDIRAFMKGDPAPEFWAYFADWDWILFCHLFGTLLDGPKGWPQLCLDIKQEMLRLGIPRSAVANQTTPEHNALNDAEWNMQLLKEIAMRERRMYGSSWLDR